MFKSCSFIVCLPSALLTLASLSAYGVARSTHGMPGLQWLHTDGRRNWSLIPYVLDIWPDLWGIAYKIGVVVTSPVTTLIVDLKRLEPDHSSQDEVWRPDHQCGLHVLDARGREKNAPGVESDIWALAEGFRHIPVGSQQALRYSYLSLYSPSYSTAWILLEEESYKIRILGMHEVKSLV